MRLYLFLLTFYLALRKLCLKFRFLWIKTAYVVYVLSETSTYFYRMILEPKQTKSATVSIVCPSICHGVMGPDAMILVF